MTTSSSKNEKGRARAEENEEIAHIVLIFIQNWSNCWAKDKAKFHETLSIRQKRWVIIYFYLFIYL